MKIQTVIVSTDEPIVEIGITTLLGSGPDFDLLGVCRTHQEMLASAQRHQPDVIVCGLSHHGGLQPIREVLAVAPDSSIVLWAREVSTELAHQAVDLGVRGFLSTTATPEHFRECLRIAGRGELWMESSLSVNLLNNRPISLSKRQSDLVGLLMQGLKNKEIATSLGISEGTVKAYLTTLYEKVGARDRFELALFGLKNFGLKNPRDRRGATASPEPLRSLIARRDSARSMEA